MVKVAIVGTGHLAEATELACQAKGIDTDCRTGDADIFWFCENTPVDEHDVSNIDWIEEKLGFWFDNIVKPGTPVLISSQIPVGTCRRWEQQWPDHKFFVVPENIRRDFAVLDFLNQSRIVVGHRSAQRVKIVDDLLSHFTDRVLWMSPESAEMSKHVLNAWLAMNICFANEMADICTLVGADLTDTFDAFRMDRRVSGPLVPGDPITGGTLLRDVRVLNQLRWERANCQIIAAIDHSNRVRL